MRRSSKTTAKKLLERLESLKPEEGFFKSRGAVKGARCFLDSKSGEGLQTVPRGLEATAESGETYLGLPGVKVRKWS